MFSLFSKLTSGIPEVLQFPSRPRDSSHMSIGNRTLLSRNRFKSRLRKGKYEGAAGEGSKTRDKGLSPFGLWSSFTVNQNQLPFKISARFVLVTCLLIGFEVWCFLNTILLSNCSRNRELFALLIWGKLFKLLRIPFFIHHICTDHHIYLQPVCRISWRGKGVICV